MRIAIGNDHAGIEMKAEITKLLQDRGHEVVNFGVDVPGRMDYPTVAKPAALAVASGECDCAILICGTGIGMSLAANKVKGIRAAVVSDACSARLTKQHNNLNVLTLGARIIGIELAKMIVEEWLDAEFMGGRHAERVQMVMDMENE
ncbi:MAG: ribose 5-phosphate isomerase B [Lachnospiraceae bacterium]|jgi:ribose 5-phosphate isomerase B|nr:ribose 5-phosphate isomerase B [Lachnospiraceae bacterium]